MGWGWLSQLGPVARAFPLSPDDGPESRQEGGAQTLSPDEILRRQRGQDEIREGMGDST